MIRDDKEDKQDNRIYHWEAGDPEATGAAFAEADRVVEYETFYPRCHPAPMETRGCVADVNPVTGKATIYMTSQAPHAHRTVFALVAGPARAPDPDHLARHRRRLRQQGADLPRLRGRHRGLAAAGPAGQVDRGPHRQPDLHRVRPRLLHEGPAGPREDGRMSACGSHAVRPGLRLRRRPAEQASAGLFHIVTGSYDIPAAHVVTDGAYTNKAPGGVAYRCSFRVTEAVLHRAAGPDGRLRARHRPGGAAAAQLHQARAVLHLGHRPVRLGQLRGGQGADKALEMLGYEDLKAEQSGPGRRAS